jgi:orotate phosphoribosyltransferase
MKLDQVPISEIEINKNIVRFSTPLIFEAKEIKELVQSSFDIYKTTINSDLKSLGNVEIEANAQTYPFLPEKRGRLARSKRSLVRFNIVFDLSKTNISFEAANYEEALKLFRLLRDQRQIIPDLATLKTLKGTFSEIIAALLWQIGAIKISLGDIKPYFKVDERKNYSPIYIDIKILTAYPSVFDFIIATSTLLLENLDFDLVCGIEAGSITLASLIAHKFSKPMFFARRKKRYPEAKLLEGINSAQLLHKNVLVVDDTIVAGWTKMRVFEEIRALGGKVDKCFVVFDRQQNSSNSLKEQGVTLYSLTDIRAALSPAIPKSITYLTDAEHKEIRKYFLSPKIWHKNKEFKYHDLIKHK